MAIDDQSLKKAGASAESALGPSLITQPAEDALNDVPAIPSHATSVPEAAPTAALQEAREPTPESQKLALEIPSQPAEDVLDVHEHDTLATALSREFLLAKAREFLQSPDIRSQDAVRKRSFLLNKGLDARDVDVLIEEMPPPPPPLPPRTYPGSGKPSKVIDMIKTLTWFFGWLATSSAAGLVLYRILILPRISNAIAAREHLQAKQRKHLQWLEGELKEAIHEPVTLKDGSTSSVAPPSDMVIEPETPGDGGEPSPDSQPPRLDTVASRLENLVSSLESLRSLRHGDHARSDTLQTVTHLTGYISSRVYQAPQFTQSGATWNKRPVLGPAEEGVRAEIRALRGLALNRRSFTAPMPAKAPGSPKPLAAVGSK